MNALIPLYVLLGLFGFIIFVALLRSIRIVPTKTSLIVERLGKYSKTLEAGFHVLVPFIDRQSVAEKRSRLFYGFGVLVVVFIVIMTAWGYMVE